jgi:signal transduction histidine kinase
MKKLPEIYFIIYRKILELMFQNETERGVSSKVRLKTRASAPPRQRTSSFPSKPSWRPPRAGRSGISGVRDRLSKPVSEIPPSPRFPRLGLQEREAGLDPETVKLIELGMKGMHLVHEINNLLATPTTRASAHSARLKRLRKSSGKIEADPHQAEALVQESEQLEKDLEQLSGPTKEILDFMRENGIGDFNPNEVVRRAIDDACRMAEGKNITIEPELDETLSYMHGNPLALLSIISNLLKNAQDALPENGGNIRVKTEKRDEEMVLEVADEGTGISKDALPCIFDFLYTTKSRDKGTGLGLFIVRYNVEAMGGSINVSSEMGKGTIFTLTFPLRKEIDYAGAGSPED